MSHEELTCWRCSKRTVAPAWKRLPREWWVADGLGSVISEAWLCPSCTAEGGNR